MNRRSRAALATHVARRVALWLCVWTVAGSLLPVPLGCASSLMLPAGLATRYPPPELAAPGQRTAVLVENAAGERLEGALYSWPGDRGTLLVSGGNAMSRSETEHYVTFLHRQGFRVLVFSFQGYDDNGGKPALASLPTDAAAFFRFARERDPEEPVGYLASSISTVAAQCLPALEPDLAVLILEGAVDAPRIGFAKVTERPAFWPLLPLTWPIAFGVSLDVPDGVDPRRCFGAPGVDSVPALYLHHPDDAVVPYSGARDLFDRYPGPSRFLDLTVKRHPTAHLLLSQDDGARRAVVEFARRHLLGEPAIAGSR